MVHYYQGDDPSELLLIEPATIDLAAAGYTEAAAELESPTGTPAAQAAAIVTAEDGATVVQVTIAGPILEVGVHRLIVTVQGAAVGVRTLAPIRVPVELPDGGGWYTIDAAHTDWSGAPEDDARLFDLLDAARAQVLAYAPALEAGTPPPATYRQAQLMQARNIWNAGITDPSSSTYGGGEFSIPIYPLDWSVRQMLRPRTGTPRIG